MMLAVLSDLAVLVVGAGMGSVSGRDWDDVRNDRFLSPHLPSRLGMTSRINSFYGF